MDLLSKISPIGAVTSAIQAAAGLGEMAYGAYEQKQANKMPHTYHIPKEIQENLTEANMRALSGLPEAQKQEYLQHLVNTSALANSQFSSLGAGTRGIAGQTNALNAGYSNLLSQDAAARLAAQGNLEKARQTMADYKDQAFNVNEYQPYLHQMGYARSLQNAGGQQLLNTLGVFGAMAGQNDKKTLDNNTSKFDKSGLKTSQGGGTLPYYKTPINYTDATKAYGRIAPYSTSFIDNSYIE